MFGRTAGGAAAPRCDSLAAAPGTAAATAAATELFRNVRRSFIFPAVFKLKLLPKIPSRQPMPGHNPCQRCPGHVGL
jgi:hypothetical protein